MLKISIPKKPRPEDYDLTQEIIDQLPIANKEFERKECKREDVVSCVSFFFAELTLFLIGTFAFHNVGKNVTIVPNVIVRGLLGCFYGSITVIPLSICVCLINYLLSLAFKLKKPYELISNNTNYENFTNYSKSYGLKIKDLLNNYPLLDKYNYNAIEYEKGILRSLYEKFIWKVKYNLKKTDENWWKGLNPFDFEKEVAVWSRCKGYRATVTSKSGDGGIDIILLKNGKKSYVQCKHYNVQVGVRLVREFYGVMASDKINEGFMVILDKGYTKDAADFVKGKNIKTITLRDLTSGFVPDFSVKELDKLYIINDLVLFKDLFNDITEAQGFVSKVNPLTIKALIQKYNTTSRNKSSFSNSLFDDGTIQNSKYTFAIIDSYSIDSNIIGIPVVIYGEYNFIRSIRASYILNEDKKWIKEEYYIGRRLPKASRPKNKYHYYKK